MTKITEDYCPKEIYKLLLEKGFDGEIHTTYDDKGYTQPSITLQVAMKWIREVHNLYCEIGYDIDLKWFFQIVDLKETVEYDYPETKYYHAENEIEFSTYEEAAEESIKHCLENLI